MSVRRCRLANKPFHRRVPEVFGHSSGDIISTFHEAAWLAGPVGVLRARVTQRGLSVIFDVPRAGAVIKHHLTHPNDVQHIRTLPDGVCGLCLARFDDNLRDYERCLWCGDNTLCRACHLPVHIQRDDGRVQACFDPAIWGPTYANIKMKHPYPEVPDGSGRVIIPGCVSCVREESLMSEAQIQAHWHSGFRRVLKEMVADNVTGLLGGYFYREFPRYYAGSRFRYHELSHHSGGGGKLFPRGSAACGGDGALNPNRIHACASLQVIAYRRMLRAWGDARRTSCVTRAWIRLSYKVCESHEASLQYRAACRLLALTMDESDSDSGLYDEIIHVPVVRCRCTRTLRSQA